MDIVRAVRGSANTTAVLPASDTHVPTSSASVAMNEGGFDSAKKAGVGVGVSDGPNYLHS